MKREFKLSKEQIQSEGWECIAFYAAPFHDSNVTWIFLKKGKPFDHELSFDDGSQRVIITQLRQTVDKTVRDNVFKGECTGVHDFRTLLRILKL